MDRLAPSPFPAPLGPRLQAALATEHATDPFSPIAVREAARRVADLADAMGLPATTYRGALDVGGAELDHVWVVVSERVVDPACPLFSPRFVECLRAYVAGHVEDEELDRVAHPYSVRWRVVGAYPENCSYLGEPVWGT